MKLFDTEAEAARKANLKAMEDKRVRFAEELAKKGIRPERMLFCSDETGGFVGITKIDGRFAVVVGPHFGTDEDFFLDYPDKSLIFREDIAEKGTGLNGAFGFGQKGAVGFKLHITLTNGEEAVFEAVAGRTSYMEVLAKKNTLLAAKRRRGDANIVWDFAPLERGAVEKIDKWLNDYYMA